MTIFGKNETKKKFRNSIFAAPAEKRGRQHAPFDFAFIRARTFFGRQKK
jgi:hypothetical protein